MKPATGDFEATAWEYNEVIRVIVRHWENGDCVDTNDEFSNCEDAFRWFIENWGGDMCMFWIENSEKLDQEWECLRHGKG